jgi:hypothetical protein
VHLISQFGAALGGTTGGITGFTQRIGGATTALAALAAGAQMFADYLDRKQEERIAEDVRAGGLAGLAARARAGDLGAAKVLLQDLESQGVTRGGVFQGGHQGFGREKSAVPDWLRFKEGSPLAALAGDEGQLGQFITQWSGFLAAQGVIADEPEKLSKATMEWRQNLAKWTKDLEAAATFGLGPGFDLGALRRGPGVLGGLFDEFDAAASKGRKDARTNINVNINRVEVPAKDPDRWIRDLSEYAAKQVRAPRRAKSALGGGGL